MRVERYRKFVTKDGIESTEQEIVDPPRIHSTFRTLDNGLKVCQIEGFGTASCETHTSREYRLKKVISFIKEIYIFEEK